MRVVAALSQGDRCVHVRCGGKSATCANKNVLSLFAITCRLRRRTVLKRHRRRNQRTRPQGRVGATRTKALGEAQRCVLRCCLRQTSVTRGYAYILRLEHSTRAPPPPNHICPRCSLMACTGDLCSRGGGKHGRGARGTGAGREAAENDRGNGPGSGRRYVSERHAPLSTTRALKRRACVRVGALAPTCYPRPSHIELYPSDVG